MIITTPDPFPGRCCNYRTRGLETVRCLDYENTPHVCSFPEPVVRIQSWGGQVQSYVVTERASWVKPGAEASSAEKESTRDG